MTIQQTIIACTAALIVTIGFTAYAMTDDAFWKPQEPSEKWCDEEGLQSRGVYEGGECISVYCKHTTSQF